MNNSNYNSLTQKLMQSGIIPSDNNDMQNEDINLFGIVPDENMENSPFVEHSVEIPEAMKKRKRLNKSDFEMISDENISPEYDNSFEIIKRFLNFKQNLASKGALGNIETFLFAFFPKLYKAKLAKDAMSKLKELNIDAKKLLDKTVPYGEGEMRYQNLIKYISYANEIQTKIKKEIS